MNILEMAQASYTSEMRLHGNGYPLEHQKLLMDGSKLDPNKELTGNEKAILGYYLLWRFVRAISVAHIFDIYEMLNVKMSISDCRGETFYAGIPQVTKEEVDFVRTLPEAITGCKTTSDCYSSYGFDDDGYSLESWNAENLDSVPNNDNGVCEIIMCNDGKYRLYKR